MSNASRSALRRALPEIGEIQRRGLRKQVEDAWLIAWRESKLRSLADAPLLAGGEIRAGVGLEHIRHTVRLTAALVDRLEVPRAPKFDRDVAVAGALLHDIGKLRAAGAKSTVSPIRHVYWGAHVAMRAKVPLEVVHIILAHSFDGDLGERSIECMVVRYADFLSADLLFRRELGVSGNAYLRQHGFPAK